MLRFIYHNEKCYDREANLLFLFGKSFVAGAGVCAMVDAMIPGSLALSWTFRVTESTSCNLLFSILDIRNGIYSYPFSTLTFLISHCFVLGLYLLVTISSPDLFDA